MKIKLLVMDVDGTLTDGKIHMGADGELFKSFHAKDGLGIVHILPKLGITPMIITGRTSGLLEKRVKELHISHLHQGISHKELLLPRLCDDLSVKLSEVAYIGDDLNDLPVMKLVGIKACPFDAVEEIKNICDFISTKNGGEGAVRDFIGWLAKEIE